MYFVEIAGVYYPCMSKNEAVDLRDEARSAGKQSDVWLTENGHELTNSKKPDDSIKID